MGIGLVQEYKGGFDLNEEWREVITSYLTVEGSNCGEELIIPI